jgi:hypothetical protein
LIACHALMCKGDFGRPMRRGVEIIRRSARLHCVNSGEVGHALPHVLHALLPSGFSCDLREVVRMAGREAGQSNAISAAPSASERPMI